MVVSLPGEVGGFRGGEDHGTFASSGGRRQAKAPRALHGALLAAGAALLVCGAVALVAAGQQEADVAGGGGPAELLLHSTRGVDDVSHDFAVSAITGRRHAARRGGLNAHSSIQDFFKAAMRGDFEKGGQRAIAHATDGLITGQSHKLRDDDASYQQLAAHRVHAKAVHDTVHAHKDTHAVPSRPGGGSRSARGSTGAPLHFHPAARHSAPAAHAKAATKAKQQQLSERLQGGAVVRRGRGGVVRGVSERHWRFPTEDKFVARYTGSVPRGDVLVDSFTSGPYVPM
mmetsp:Transcript_9020/g.21039  ORF Transcript_9020/g.21039 Transcript_9020/m.21039 type:complete len:286 (-) Transcript_9020:104-961(-)